MKRTSCASCGKYFTGTTEFDAHRIGPYGFTPTRRRCMGDDEMKFEGWQSAYLAISNEEGKPVRQVWARKAVAEPLRGRRFAKTA